MDLKLHTVLMDLDHPKDVVLIGIIGLRMIPGWLLWISRLKPTIYQLRTFGWEVAFMAHLSPGVHW